MSNSKAAVKPDIKAADQGESVGLMEPLFISESSRHRAPMSDLAIELAAQSSGFRKSLPKDVLEALASLVRSMNCYYSNLIEGHNTHPIDIERAIENDYSKDADKRVLQREARAHIEVQKWIASEGLSGRAMTRDGIAEIHRRFCELLPEDLLYAENPDTRERLPVVPGEFRTCDVKVGRHIPVSPGSLTRFLDRFEQGYARLGRTDAIIAIAGAHHRFVWIHPFLDGNGRVARLMSDAMLLETLNTGGLWSVSRGLAHGSRAYKDHLGACDMERRNDLDGRGHLSEESLAKFTRYFLETCIDQVKFMESLVQPERLHKRIVGWAEEEIQKGGLPTKSGAVLEAILYRGELPRSEVAKIVGTSERQARRVTSALTKEGVMNSESSRAPLRLVFPARLASRWMPGLFPEHAGGR